MSIAERCDFKKRVLPMKRFPFFVIFVLLAALFMPKMTAATCGCAAGRVSPLFCLPTQATKAALGLLEATGVISSKESYTSEVTTIAMGAGMALFGGLTANSILMYKGLTWAANGAVTLVARSHAPHVEGLVFDLTYIVMAGTAYSFGGSFGKARNHLYAFVLPSLVKVSGRALGYIWDVFSWQMTPSAPVQQGSTKGEFGGDEEAFTTP